MSIKKYSSLIKKWATDRGIVQQTEQGRAAQYAKFIEELQELIDAYRIAIKLPKLIERAIRPQNPQKSDFIIGGDQYGVFPNKNGGYYYKRYRDQLATSVDKFIQQQITLAKKDAWGDVMVTIINFSFCCDDKQDFSKVGGMIDALRKKVEETFDQTLEGLVNLLWYIPPYFQAQEAVFVLDVILGRCVVAGFEPSDCLEHVWNIISKRTGSRNAAGQFEKDE